MSNICTGMRSSGGMTTGESGTWIFYAEPGNDVREIRTAPRSGHGERSLSEGGQSRSSFLCSLCA